MRCTILLLVFFLSPTFALAQNTYDDVVQNINEIMKPAYDSSYSEKIVVYGDLRYIGECVFQYNQRFYENSVFENDSTFTFDLRKADRIEIDDELLLRRFEAPGMAVEIKTDIFDMDNPKLGFYEVRWSRIGGKRYWFPPHGMIYNEDELRSEVSSDERHKAVRFIPDPVIEMMFTVSKRSDIRRLRRLFDILRRSC